MKGGGPAAIRGFQAQTLIALLDALDKDRDWLSLKLEPKEASEKVDILWKYPGRTKAIQVKSSKNPFEPGKVKKWAAELEAWQKADDYELVLVGQPSPSVSGGNRIGNVAVRLEPLDFSAFKDRAGHRLHRLLPALGLPECDAGQLDDLVALLAENLTSASVHSKELTQEELRDLLKTWILRQGEAVRIIRIFVSASDDVAKERTALEEVIASVNRAESEAHQATLQLHEWTREAEPRIGRDVFLAILSTRFGEGDAEAALRRAIEVYKGASPPWVAFYFDDAPKTLRKQQEVMDYAEVCGFCEDLASQGIVCRYVGVRETKDSFHARVLEHLTKVLHIVAPSTGNENWAKVPSQLVIPSEYTDWLLGRCGEVELMGLEIKHGSGVRLNHVYTPLATSSRPEQPKRGKRGRDEEMMAKEQESKQLLLALLDRQSLYVSGDPGSGKSTFCRWVIWLTCNGKMPTVDVPAPDEYQETFPEHFGGRLPVLVRLRDFWQHLPSKGVRSVGLGGLEHALEVWLADQKYPGMNWPCLKGHLEHGSALLLLDGVDEVPPIRTTDGHEWYPREMLLTGLAEAMASWTKTGNRVLVTSRPYGLSGEQQRKLALQPAPILGLDQELQALLVRRWFLLLKEDHGLGLETADAMIDHIHVERGLDDLAINPLLLTAMCIIYDEGKRLPHDKYTLYDRIVDTVLHKRYAGRERIDPIRGRLAAVALGMHTGEALGQRRSTPEAAASDSEIDLILQAYQQLDGSTDGGLTDVVRVREDLLSQSGLLVDRGDEGASFYHLSIQEYLAAQRLFLLHGRKQDELMDLFVTRGPVAGWRNTLSFVLGCVAAKFSTHVGVECLQDLAKRTQLPAVASAERGQEDGIWRLAIVLGDCLEILSGLGAELPTELTDFFRRCAFQGIEQEIAVDDRHTLAVILGRLGDPRVMVDLRVTTHPDDHAGYVKIPEGKYKIGDNEKSKYPEWSRPKDEETIVIAKPFWLSKYPVTNSQYALFVDDDGYSRQEFWSDEGWKWIEGEGIKTPDYWRNPDFNAPNQPVVGVAWWEAEAFCKWAGVRLPKADEAEAATRGPEGFEYPWGKDWEDGICNSDKAGLGGTSAVGIFPRDRSPFGVIDMAGNVLEWCQEAGTTWDEKVARVIRGGGWGSDAGLCRAANRGWNVPRSRVLNLGFRVAAVPPSESSRETASKRQEQANKRAEPGA